MNPIDRIGELLLIVLAALCVISLSYWLLRVSG